MATNIILITLLAFFQGVDPDVYCKQKNIICWCESQPLTWEDFQGKANFNKPQDANISMRYVWSNKYVKKQKKIKIIFYAMLDKDLSWKKPGSSSDYLLHHEQVHFDIQEWHARLIRKAFQEIEFDFPDEIDEVYKQIDKTYEYYRDKAKEVQKVYDEETNHSINKDKQKEWNEKIAKELEELKDFANPHFDIQLIK